MTIPSQRVGIPARAFTLIELLITIAVIGIIAAIIAVTVNQGRVRAQETAIVSDLKSFAAEANILHSETGSYAGISDCKDSESDFNKFVEGIEKANGTVVSCTGDDTDWSVIVNYPATEPTKSFSIGPSGAVVQGEPGEEGTGGGSGSIVWDTDLEIHFFIYAEPVCIAKGMRIPTINEVIEGFNAGIFDDVPNVQGAYIMSSTEHTPDSVIVKDRVLPDTYYWSYKAGPVGSYFRCVQDV